MKINLYDFDKTIYDGDSSVDFIKYTMKKYPKSILKLPIIGMYAIGYKLKINSKEKMKEKIFSIVKNIKDIDSYVENFWILKEKNIKDFYLKKDHSNDVIISASPEFLLKPICKKLKVKKLIASPISKSTGLYDGINCYGEEKVRRLNEIYKDYEVEESYSDSLSDIPILRLAKRQYIVKGNELKEVDYK